MVNLETFGKRLQFACGFILGAIIALCRFSESDLTGWGLVFALALPFCFGFAAYIWGDKFWYGLLKTWRRR